MDHGVDLRHIFLDIALRYFEERPLGLLHQVVHIGGLVEGFALHLRRESDQLAGQIFLGNDAGMKFDMGTTAHLAGQVGNITGPACYLQLAPLAELLDHGHHINRLLFDGQVNNGTVDCLVFLVVETLGFQYLADNRIGIFLQHQRP